MPLYLTSLFTILFSTGTQEASITNETYPHTLLNKHVINLTGTWQNPEYLQHGAVPNIYIYINDQRTQNHSDKNTINYIQNY